MPACDSGPQFVVLWVRTWALRCVASYFIERGLSDHDRAVDEWIVEHEFEPENGWVGGVAVKTHTRPRRTEDLCPRPDHRDVGMSIQELDLLCEAIRKRYIVRILSGNVAASCDRDTPIQGDREPLVLLPQKGDSRVGIGANDVCGVIRRAIVDCYEFKVRKGLGKHAVDRLA